MASRNPNGSQRPAKVVYPAAGKQLAKAAQLPLLSVLQAQPTDCLKYQLVFAAVGEEYHDVVPGVSSHGQNTAGVQKHLLCF